MSASTPPSASSSPAEDDNNNVDPNYSGNVFVTLNGTGNLNGMASVPVVNGTATFSGLSVDQLDETDEDTLSVSATGLQDATTNPFDVTTATHLAVFVLGNVSPGVPFSAQIEVLGSDDQIDSNYTGGATLSLSTNPTNAMLGGTTNVQIFGGSGFVSDLTVDKLGTNYVLQAASTGLSAGTSTFDVATPLPATHLSLLIEGAAPTFGPPLTNGTFSVSVTALAANGSTANSYSGPVTISFVTNPGNGTLGGTVSGMITDGSGFLSAATINEPGTGYTLQATSGSLSGVSSPFNVTNDQLAVPTPPPDQVAGVPFAFSVQAQNSAGALDAAFHGAVTAVISGATSGDVTVTATAVHGVATFTGIVLDQANPFYDLTLTSPGVAQGFTDFAVDAAPATHLAVTQAATAATPSIAGRQRRSAW